MATQTFFSENYAALTRTVERWDRRLRLRQMVLWLPLSLLPGLALGLVLALLARMRPLLLPAQIALITVGLMLVGGLIFALAVWVWRRSTLTSAQRFDIQFGLDERISTALELGTGTIHTLDELALRQLEDAHAHANSVRVRDHLPLELSRRDWLTVIVLAAILALLLLLPNPQNDALTQESIQQAAVDDAAETLRDLTQDIAADTTLDETDREALLQELQTATSTLEQPNVTPEEAFAALSAAQTELQERSEQLRQQAGANQAALEQAADALRQAGQQGGDNPNQGQAGAAGTMEQVTQDLENIAQNASEMSPAEQQQAQQSLRDAAQALQNTNPQASESLEQAADQLGDAGDQEAMQQSLDQAQQQMQQQSQNAQQQEQAAENLDEAAQQAQQSAEQIGDPQQSQPNQQSQPSDQQGQQQEGEEGQPQEGQQGEQVAQQGQSEAESESPQSGQPSEQNADQQSDQSAASGSGDSASDQGSESAQQQQANGQAQTNNDPDGAGQGEFESINVPQRIGQQGNDGNNVELAPDPSDSPLQEGDFSENPTGQVNVPYNQVFSDYADAANRALGSDYVPLGLRDIVRDYFTSLEPGR